MMKALARTTLVVLILFTGVSSLIHASCDPEPVETVTPYNIPNGLINIIEHSENPSTPFWAWVEEEYPLFKTNYTVQLDGWLEIYTTQFNGTRPEILVNGDEIYATMNPFFDEKVYKDDFIQLTLYPPENLDSSFTIEVDNQALTTYEVYNWEDLIGEITFRETPRPEIDVTINYTPMELIEPVSLIISADGFRQGYSWLWTLDGGDVQLEHTSTHLITPQLGPGEYTIGLSVEDMFGYTQTVQKMFTVEMNEESLLYDPSLTSIDVVDLYAPGVVEPGSLMDATVSVTFTTPVPRDVRLSIVDTVTGEPVSSLEDQVIGEGAKSYAFSFASKDVNMNLEARAVYLHEEEWLQGGEVKATFVTVMAEVEEKSIPGYPYYGLALGLMAYILKRRSLVS